MKKVFLNCMLLLCALIVGSGNVWADPVVLFHETFGDNSGSARDWDNSYSVKSGVSAVYSGISSYTVSNAKQGKNTTGSTKSGLNQSSQGTDAYIIIGPLNVESYESLSLTYQWKAASIKGTYSTSLYYATSSGGSYTEVSGIGKGATTFVKRSYSLPAEAQVSTLYLKIVWNTSNTQAIIDEVDLQGILSAGGDPSVIVSSTEINLTKDEVDDGAITVTYNNITSVNAEIKYYEADGTTPAADDPEWIVASIDASNNVEYLVDANTGSKRIAYLKVHEISKDVYSDLITITQASGIATPTFDNGTATYSSVQSVAISCATDGATIYYTTDESDPTVESTKYESPVLITVSETVLKAIAYKSGGHSEIASATYTIRPATPEISAVGATVTITGTEGCEFYYTTDNSTPSKSSTKYAGPFNLSEDCTIKTYAYDAYNNRSNMATYTFKYMPLAPKNINSGYFEKVTDVSSLENGDAILIVYETDQYAMNTTQNTNNRAKTSISILSNVIYAPTADVQKLTLVKMREEISEVEKDVFYFYTGEGYLYAASNSYNHLKTEENPDNNNNARATISITDGDATILFTGTNSHNWLKYNSNSNIFSCYASNDKTQAAVQIYKEVAHNETKSISAAGWATFCSDYALNFAGSGVSAYIITGHNGSAIIKSKEPLANVPANTPLLLNASTSGIYNIPVIASSSTSTSGNMLVRGTGEAVGYVANKTRYVLMAKNSTTAEFQLLADGGASATVGTDKAYLQFNEVINLAPAALRLTDEESGATNIDAIDATEDSVKFIENGKLFIKKNGVVYDMLGTVVRK